LEVFAKWNDVARAILPSILEVTDIARTCFPDNVPDHAVKRVQSYLVGAASELYYDNYISCHLSRNIIDIYRVGHFPCGWHVESEEAFPEKATVVVF